MYIYCMVLTSSGSLSIFSNAQPLLYEPLWQAARAVKAPNPLSGTLYDEWLNISSKDYGGVLKPEFHDLGSGSDYVAFAQTLGISSADLKYVSLNHFVMNDQWIADLSCHSQPLTLNDIFYFHLITELVKHIILHASGILSKLIMFCQHF